MVPNPTNQAPTLQLAEPGADDPDGKPTEEREELSPREENDYDHIGFSHLDAIGNASSSLALISTLVFSICVAILLETDFMHSPLAMNFLCVSTTCSTYTLCYSILEYYYVQMFKGVEDFIGKRVKTSRGAGSGLFKSMSSVSNVAERATLVKNVRSVFATLNTMRGAARNSMWLGLVCLVVSAIAKIDIVGDLAPDWRVSPSGKGAVFFGVMLLLVGGSWSRVRSPDLRAYSLVAAAGWIVCTLHASLAESEFPAGKLIAILTLLAVIGIVPFTVMKFRLPLAKVLRDYVDVF